ncbi:MAG: pitrilysin family protein [Candidatus Woesearchaeota archaeon]|jgi:predicted Zn-dependent peptidase
MFHKRVLSNGLTIIHNPVVSETVTVEFSVHTGSVAETSAEAGLSHFLEHLLFEGTVKRPSSKIIANEIEKYGGEFNAATSPERTFYYVKIAKKHFTVALDILSDMFSNSLLDAGKIEKERKVILDEINIVNDNPRHYQWILFNKALYGKHPAAKPVYGNLAALKKITRQQILSNFQKHYIPSQITVLIVGDIPHAMDSVEKICGLWKFHSLPQLSSVNMVPYTKKMLKEKKKLSQSYLVLGYQTVVRAHSDSIILDVICGILGRGQSGWLFDEIRAKRGLCYSVGIDYDGAKSYGGIGVYCGMHKKNIPKVQSLILEQFEKLKNVSETDVSEAKTFVEGVLALRHENTASYAEELAYWHFVASLEQYHQYISRLQKITAADVQRVAKKYFTQDYTMAVLEQEK